MASMSPQATLPAQHLNVLANTEALQIALLRFCTEVSLHGGSCLVPALGSRGYLPWQPAPDPRLSWQPPTTRHLVSIQKDADRGAWVAQSVKQPTSAQVMISRSVSSSPTSGSVLTAQSPEPVSDSVSPSL